MRYYVHEFDIEGKRATPDLPAHVKIRIGSVLLAGTPEEARAIARALNAAANEAETNPE